MVTKTKGSGFQFETAVNVRLPGLGGAGCFRYCKKGRVRMQREFNAPLNTLGTSIKFHPH